MKAISLFFTFGMFAVGITSTARAQSTPAAPKATTPVSASTARTTRKIPPPPPIYSIVAPRKRSFSTARSKAAYIPGVDPSGRVDLNGSPVAFYPTSKGVNPGKSRAPTAQKAVKESSRKR